MSPEARDHSFDELTRGLASGTLSRGKALRLMGAALVGGTLALLGIGEAAAAPGGCKRNGKHCKRNDQCCSLNCDSSSGTCAAAPPTCVSDGGACTADGQCCSGLLCDNGKCATCRSNGGSCAAGEPCCSGNCSGTTCACRPTGSVCTDLSQCCNAHCENGKCCIPELQDTSAFGFCNTDADCCGGLDCIDGICLS
jgi:hypothetical protein